MQRALLALFSLLWAAPAAAQEVDPLAPPTRGAPAPLQMDRFDKKTRYAVQIDSTMATSGDTSFAERLELHAQRVSYTGLGVYGALQVAKVFGEAASAVGISDVELGGFLVAEQRGFDLVVRLGFGLPTASTEVSAQASNLAAAFGRISDISRVTPAYLVRPSMTLTTRGRAFLRADLGLDVSVDKSAGDDGARGTSTVARANVGGGFATASVALLAELCGLFDTEAISDGGLLYQPAVGFRFLRGRLHPSLAVATLLGDDFAVGDLITVSLGVSGTL